MFLNKEGPVLGRYNRVIQEVIITSKLEALLLRPFSKITTSNLKVVRLFFKIVNSVRVSLATM